MKLLKNTFFLFTCVCIPMRLLFAYFVKQTPQKYINYLGILLAVFGFSFLFSYFNFNPRSDIGAFGGKIWWNNMRAVHGSLFLIYALIALHYKKNKWIILVIDPFIGLFAYWLHKLN